MESRLARLLEDVPEWVEASPYPIGICDNVPVLLYVNRTLAALIRRTRKQIVGTPLLDFIDAAHADRVAEELRSRRSGRSEPYVVKFRIPGAEPVHQLLFPQPIRAADGEVLGSLAVAVALPNLDGVADALSLDRGVSDGARALLQQVGDLLRRRTDPSLDDVRRRDPVATQLSAREWEVLSLLHRGARVRNVAQRLGLSENTVRSHLKSIFRKLGVSSQAELVDWVDRALAGPDDARPDDEAEPRERKPHAV